MIRIRLSLVAAVLLAALASPRIFAAEPEVVSVTKIWDAGKHNAFTDLIRWHDRWYCAFREGDAHVGGDGKLRVLVSSDGVKWESAALLSETGIDLRDPKLSVTPEDRLMIVAGGSVYEGKTFKGRQPRVAFSKDGTEWTPPRRVLDPDEWLWRVTWSGGLAYGVSYNAAARTTKEAQDAAREGKAPPGPADWKLKLVRSADGIKYDLVTHLDVPGHPNETTIRFLANGDMIALVRREGGNQFGWIGRSAAPYKEWKWHETKHRFGGPNFIVLPDASLWAAGRIYPGSAKTCLARMKPDGHYEPALTLTSGGDTSYPGLAWREGLLWMSFYSSHEGKSAIYLAKIRLPLQPESLGSRREPFVDEHLIERLIGSAKIRVQQPEPKEVVFTADAPWEGNTSAYFTVLREGDRYRMYYRGSHFDEKTKKATHPEVTCYAESKDGRTFTRPELGLFEFAGAKKNNIVWDGPGAHNFTPFVDTNPKCPPEARFKALAGGRGGLLALASADGLRWKPLAEKPVITRGAFDSQNLAFWDGHAGKYREYHRDFRRVRDIRTGTSDDFLTWTEPDFLDYPGATPEQLYTNAVQPHPGAPHLLVGFPTRFLPARQQTEPTFMVSRDGRTFQRYADAIIPTTAPKDRDGNRSNYLANGIVELPDRPGELSVYAKEAYYTGTGSRVRRFVYRVDGFAGLVADATGGEVVTRPLTFTGTRLVLNYRTGTGGSVRVELQDANGKPLPGFSAQEAELRGDELAKSVSWTRNSDLRALAGQAVRLRLVVTDATVFSFRFE